MKIELVGFADYEAIYKDGVLVYWGEEPTGCDLLNFIGVEHTYQIFPREMNAVVSKNKWKPPSTVQELLKEFDGSITAKIDEEIHSARMKLEALEKKRWELVR